MTHKQTLPTLKTLKRIAHESGPFPNTPRNLLRHQKPEWFDDEVVGLLRLFPENEVFHDRKEFVERCESVRATEARQDSETL